MEKSGCPIKNTGYVFFPSHQRFLPFCWHFQCGFYFPQHVGIFSPSGLYELLEDEASQTFTMATVFKGGFLRGQKRIRDLRDKACKHLSLKIMGIFICTLGTWLEVDKNIALL